MAVALRAVLGTAGARLEVVLGAAEAAADPLSPGVWVGPEAWAELRRVGALLREHGAGGADAGNDSYAGAVE